MRSTLIVLSIAALLAVGAGSASARFSDPREPAPAPLQHRYVGRDLVAVAPDTPVAAPVAVRASRAPSAPVSDHGFKWGDAAVGAGLLAALLALSAGGVVLARRARPLATR